MKYYYFLFFALLLCLFSAPAYSQSGDDEDATVYLLKSDFTGAKNSKEATYFLQVIKEDDTTNICRYYNSYGSMLRQEVFRDTNFSIPHGRFCWYNAKGNLDSTGILYNGHKDGTWGYFNDTLGTTLSIVYDADRIIEKRDYVTNIYTDENGKTSDLKQKEKTERDAFVADSIAGKQQLKEATFNNDIKKWQRYLEKKLKVPERLITVKGKGNYTVLVCFLINKEGKTDDIFLLHSCEWSADAKVFHLIKDSPLWQPATRNGIAVYYRQKQSITLQVNEE